MRRSFFRLAICRNAQTHYIAARRELSQRNYSVAIAEFEKAFRAAPSHELIYEKQHTKLLQASAEWLRFGTSEGRSPGSISK